MLEQPKIAVHSSYIAACSAACAADLTSASATELWSHFVAVVLTYVPDVK